MRERKKRERSGLWGDGALRCRMRPSGRKQSQVSDSKHWASLSHGREPGKQIQTPVPHFLSTIRSPKHAQNELCQLSCPCVGVKHHQTSDLAASSQPS